MTPPVNERIAKLQVRRTVELIRQESRTLQRLLAMWTDIENELRAKLTSIDPTAVKRTAWQQERLQKLHTEAERILKGGYRDIRNAMDEDSLAMVGRQLEWAAEAINKVVGIDLAAVTSTPERQSAIIDDHMIDGSPAAEWWQKQEADTLFRFKASMGRGMLQGETIDQLTKRIASEVGPAAGKNITALVRTSFMQAANDANMAVYRDNSDVLDGVMWLATLDMRTCTRCAPLDGASWDFAGQPLKGDQEFRQAPLHFQCRCCMSPVVKSWETLMAEQGGRNTRLARALDSMTPGTRASMNGQIPASVDYADWESGG